MADVTTTMKQNIIDADKAGLQVRIHAIGDRANATILDYYAEAEKADGARDRRFTIEHAQHLRMDDLKRFGGQKVVASMQPYHIIDDGRWAWKRLDPARLKEPTRFAQYLTQAEFLLSGPIRPSPLGSDVRRLCCRDAQNTGR